MLRYFGSLASLTATLGFVSLIGSLTQPASAQSATVRDSIPVSFVFVDSRTHEPGALYYNCGTRAIGVHDDPIGRGIGAGGYSYTRNPISADAGDGSPPDIPGVQVTYFAGYGSGSSPGKWGTCGAIASRVRSAWAGFQAWAVYSLAEERPVAKFTWETEGLIARLDGTPSYVATTAGRRPVSSFAWSVGGVDATTEHTFDAPGEYSVSLTVTDGAGGSDTYTESVIVSSHELTIRSVPLVPDALYAEEDTLVVETILENTGSFEVRDVLLEPFTEAVGRIDAPQGTSLVRPAAMRRLSTREAETRAVLAVGETITVIDSFVVEKVGTYRLNGATETADTEGWAEVHGKVVATTAAGVPVQIRRPCDDGKCETWTVGPERALLEATARIDVEGTVGRGDTLLVVGTVKNAGDVTVYNLSASADFEIVFIFPDSVSGLPTTDPGLRPIPEDASSVMRNELAPGDTVEIKRPYLIEHVAMYVDGEGIEREIEVLAFAEMGEVSAETEGGDTVTTERPCVAANKPLGGEKFDLAFSGPFAWVQMDDPEPEAVCDLGTAISPGDKSLVVNDERDLPDLDLEDGVCDAVDDAEEEGNQCTLRAAIEEANERGEGEITFDIESDGAPSIVVNYNSVQGTGETLPLPKVTVPATIDGTTQPGGRVEVAGVPLGQGEDANGIVIGKDAGGSIVRGLVINGFSGYGILVEEGADGCLIEQNWVGPDATGLRAVSNGSFFVRPLGDPIGGGVRLNSDDNEIKGNLLSGNWTRPNNPGICCGGVDLWLGPTANGNRVVQNNFGSNVKGEPILLDEPNISELEHLYLGLFVEGDNNTIGGSAADGNTFNGNVFSMFVLGDDIEVSHNRIGPADPAGITTDMHPLNSSGIAIGATIAVPYWIGGDGERRAHRTDIHDNTANVSTLALTLMGDDNVARENHFTVVFPFGVRRDSEIRRNFQNAVEVDGSNNILELNQINSGVWGINIEEGTGHRIERNTIEAGWGGIGFHQNVMPDEPAEALITTNNIRAPYFGIDFGEETYVPNDASDSDEGPNTLLNYPVVTQASREGATLTVEGFVQTGLLTFAPYTIEVFQASTCTSVPRAVGVPEAGSGANPLFATGERYLGRAEVSPSLGEATFAISLENASPDYPIVTLTASRHDLGVTSQFGRCVGIVDADQTARADVEGGQTGELLAAQDVVIETSTTSTVPAARNATAKAPQAPSSDAASEGGTLYVTRYETTPDTSGIVKETAISPDGSVVKVASLAPVYWWLTDRNLTPAGGADSASVTFRVCLRPGDRVSDQEVGRFVVVQRSLSSGGGWIPHDTEEVDRDGERYLCSAGLMDLGEFGLGSPETAFPVSIEDGPSPSDHGEVFTFSIAPNPNSGTATLHLALPQSGPVQIEAFDTLGRRMGILHSRDLSDGMHLLPLDLGSLSSGVYLIRATTPDGLVTRRLTIAN